MRIQRRSWRSLAPARLKADTRAGMRVQQVFAISVLAAATLISAPSAQQPAAVRAFTGARLIDGTDRAPIANATIVVQDGRIVAAGPATSVNVPAGAERVALNGKTVIPGLINAHGHVNDPKDLRTYAAYGITTVYSARW